MTEACARVDRTTYVCACAETQQIYAFQLNFIKVEFYDIYRSSKDNVIMGNTETSTG